MEPKMIISGSHKFIIAADEESLLWCHPPYASAMYGAKPYKHMDSGRSACGVDDGRHCEVTVFLNKEEELPRTLHPNRRVTHIDWYHVRGHVCTSMSPLTIHPCLMCPYCMVHVYMVDSNARVVYAEESGDYWDEDGSVRLRVT